MRMYSTFPGMMAGRKAAAVRIHIHRLKAVLRIHRLTTQSSTVDLFRQYCSRHRPLLPDPCYDLTIPPFLTHFYLLPYHNSNSGYSATLAARSLNKPDLNSASSLYQLSMFHYLLSDTRKKEQTSSCLDKVKTYSKPRP